VPYPPALTEILHTHQATFVLRTLAARDGFPGEPATRSYDRRLRPSFTLQDHHRSPTSSTPDTPGNTQVNTAPDGTNRKDMYAYDLPEADSKHRMYDIVF
jgi:hypothetical protein